MRCDCVCVQCENWNGKEEEGSVRIGSNCGSVLFSHSS
jgi:hypothetical protein